jgi:hypothetical protein
MSRQSNLAPTESINMVICSLAIGTAGAYEGQPPAEKNLLHILIILGLAFLTLMFKAQSVQ